MTKPLDPTPSPHGLRAALRRHAIGRRAFVGGASALAAAPLLLPRSLRAQDGPRQGGRSVWSISGDPVAINPIESPGGHTRDAIYDTVYESLLMYDEDFELQPALATSWENPDPLTWIFHLRQGVLFHHGRELDAEDIVFWHENLFDPDIVAPHKSYFLSVSEVIALDRHTVEMRLSEPLGPILRNFAQLFGASILPRDWKDAVPNLEMHAIGTGPFKVEEFAPASHILFRRHEQYWDQPYPRLDEVVLRVLPDAESRIGALRTGSIHYANLSPDDALRLEGNPRVEVIRTPSSLVFTHMFNTRIPPFDDVRVRRAVDRAIDRQEVIDKVAGGEGRLTGPVPTGMGRYPVPPDELPYRRDLDEARRLLAEAGYPDGFQATLLTRTSIPENIQSSVIMAEQLRPLGIRLDIEQLEPGVFAARTREYDFNVIANIWSPRVDPDAYFGRTFLSIDPQNWMGWGDPEFDELIFEARRPGTDDDRVPLYRVIQARILDEVPVIWWYQANTIEGVSTEVKGYWGSFLGRRPAMKHAWLASGA
jgi:peptide/nickel transport system substrate-binding protein